MNKRTGKERKGVPQGRVVHTQRPVAIGANTGKNVKGSIKEGHETAIPGEGTFTVVACDKSARQNSHERPKMHVKALKKRKDDGLKEPGKTTRKGSAFSSKCVSVEALK